MNTASYKAMSEPLQDLVAGLRQKRLLEMEQKYRAEQETSKQQLERELLEKKLAADAMQRWEKGIDPLTGRPYTTLSGRGEPPADAVSATSTGDNIPVDAFDSATGSVTPTTKAVAPARQNTKLGEERQRSLQTTPASVNPMIPYMELAGKISGNTIEAPVRATKDSQAKNIEKRQFSNMSEEQWQNYLAEISRLGLNKK